MRILWFTKDSVWCSSAYGRITRELLPRLTRRHRVASFTPIGLVYGRVDWDGVMLYPGIEGRGMSEDILVRYYEEFKADLLITSIDVWPLQHVPRWARERRILWASYLFIDYDNVGIIRDRLKEAFVVVPTTRWTKRMAEKVYDTVLDPCRLGIDLRIFHPLGDSKADVLEHFPKGRKSLFGPTCDFGIGIFAANQTWRKSWEEMLRAVRLFIERNPDIRVGLYVHSDPNVLNQYNLVDLVREIGIPSYKFADSFLMMTGGHEDEDMVRRYNVCDVTLYTTAGEGFGWPVLESLACGTPVVSGDYSAMKEINPFDELRVPASRTTYTPNPVLKKWVPDVEATVRALERVLNSDPERY